MVVTAFLRKIINRRARSLNKPAGQRQNKMEARELKKLNKELREFIDESSSENLRVAIAEFWFAKFGCNNKEREDELYEYFLLN